MKLSTALGLGMALTFAMNANASFLNYGDVVQVGNRAGSVFTPNSISGDSNGLYTSVSYRINGGSSSSANAGLYVMDYSYQMGNSATQWQEFYSFCLEPHVSLSSFSNPYTAKTVSGAGYPSEEIAELWGRYRNLVNNDLTAAAFQVSLWEIAYGNDATRDLSSGAFRLTNTNNAVFTLATSWLNSLNGLGPRAYNLLVLVDNPNDQHNRQDLITQIPAPASLALFGLGLLGFGAMRRRQ